MRGAGRLVLLSTVWVGVQIGHRLRVARQGSARVLEEFLARLRHLQDRRDHDRLVRAWEALQFPRQFVPRR
jgi:hypothetical protein